MARKNIYRNGYELQPVPFNYKPVVFVILIILIAFSVFAVITFFKTDSPSKYIQAEVKAPIILPYDFSEIILPDEGQSALGTAGFGVIKTSLDIEKPAPMASITKIITVLAILQKSDLKLGEKGKIIVLTAQDEQYYRDYLAIDGTITPVTAGLEMNEYEALQAILLPSSNNMTDSLVDRYFSNREEFLNFANSMISSFGLTNTRLADASGFSPESVSTPSDLIIIGQKALQNPIIAEIVAQPNATVAVAGSLRNYNMLISEPGVTGIKPGATDQAGYCLLFSANTTNKAGQTETIIGAVMGINDRVRYYDSALQMLNDAKSKILTQ